MKLFDGKRSRLCVDQYGGREWARTLAELKSKCYRRSARKVYVDRGDDTLHVGYEIGGRWFSIFAPVESIAR